MARVLDLLRTEHGNIGRILAFLERQLAIFSHVGEPDYQLMIDALDYTRDYADAYHHPKEDLVLEKLRERDAVAAAAVGDLVGEHVKLAELTRHFSSVVEAVVADSMVSRERVVEVGREFIDAQRAHMAFEEQTFFAAAQQSLEAQDWNDVDAAFAELSDPVFGHAIADSFETLSREVQRDSLGPS